MAEKEYIEREEIIKRIKLRIDDYSRDCNSFAQAEAGIILVCVL